MINKIVATLDTVEQQMSFAMITARTKEAALTLSKSGAAAPCQLFLGAYH